ncbi:MAG: enoyl-CoA hydratase/isomerase family protein [Chloroflexi bacterium]|nr:enoyl-CoA hydratase/isomerase family protein [Chloroflexota bacterium]
MPDVVTTEIRGNVALLTLNRPERSNAMIPPMLEAFETICADLARKGEVRALVVTGAGKAFCSGGDVQAWESGGGPREREASGSRRDVVDVPTRVILPFRQFPGPVIAAINGVAAGAGLGLALAADLRIASTEARLGSLFVKRGIAPGNGISWNLPRIVGTAKALEIMLTGDWVSPQEAERIGLVNKVVAPEQLLPTALEWANKIAANPPIAVELTKKAVWRGMESDLLPHLEQEHYYQQITFASEDFKESVKSFLEKREPRYRGR